MAEKAHGLSLPSKQWWQKLTGENAEYFNALAKLCTQEYHPHFLDWGLISIIPGNSRRLVSGKGTDGYAASVRAAAAQVEIEALRLLDMFHGNKAEYGWDAGGIGRRRGRIAEISPEQMYVDQRAVSIYRRSFPEETEVETRAEVHPGLMDAISQYLNPRPIAIPVFA